MFSSFFFLKNMHIHIYTHIHTFQIHTCICVYINIDILQLTARRFGSPSSVVVVAPMRNGRCRRRQSRIGPECSANNTKKKKEKKDNNLRNVAKGEGAAGESRGVLCLGG